MNIFQGHANKKYQKKVIKLIDATMKKYESKNECKC